MTISQINQASAITKQGSGGSIPFGSLLVRDEEAKARALLN